MVKKKMRTSVVTCDVGRWAVVVEEKTLCIRILCNLPYLSFFPIFLVKLMFCLFNFCYLVHSYILQRFSLLLFLTYCLLMKLDL